MRETGSGLLVEEGILVPNVELLVYRGKHDEDGDLLDIIKVHNSKTNNATYGTVDQLLASPTLAKPQYTAVGTGTPGANALGAESARSAFTSKTRSTNVLTMSADFAPGTATAALTEAGIFDANTAGNMWFYTTFAVINKDANMDLVINWTFTLT